MQESKTIKFEFQKKLIMRIYFDNQNVEKHKKDTIATLSFPNLAVFIIPEEIRISEISLQHCLLRYYLTTEKWLFLYIKNKKDKKEQPTEVGFLKQKKALP